MSSPTNCTTPCLCILLGILQNLLEVSRRYKITNPEKMRSEYGKLVYLMQDADTPEIKQLLGMCVFMFIWLKSCSMV